MLSFTEFRRIRRTYMDFETRSQCRLIWNKYMLNKKKKMNSTPVAVTSGTCTVAYNELAQYISPAHMHTYSLGTIDVAQPPASTSGLNWYCNQEKGNNPMNYATATVQAGTTETQDQRKYLAKRLDEVFYKLEAPLYAQFGLTDDEAPSTPKELAQRIKDGKFVIKGLPKDDADEDTDDMYFHGYWTSLLRWRDPAKKADMDGYSAATKELKDLRQKTLDIIKIDEPKAGLDAIKALEAWIPTGAAN